jgi:hypothetical protein
MGCTPGYFACAERAPHSSCGKNTTKDASDTSEAKLASMDIEAVQFGHAGEVMQILTLKLLTKKPSFPIEATKHSPKP